LTLAQKTFSRGLKSPRDQSEGRVSTDFRCLGRGGQGAAVPDA
jgi:hypothetical protein